PYPTVSQSEVIHGQQLVQDSQGIQAQVGQDGEVPLAPGARAKVPQYPAAARLDPHRPRVRPAQLRRHQGHRGACRAARQLAAERGPRRRDSVRRRARGPAGFHRRAPARRPRRHALGGRPHRQGPEGDRAAGARGPRGRPLGDDRPLRHAQGAGPQHEAGVQAQRRALPVHEMGHAGRQDVRCRASRLPHRPPAQPGAPGRRVHKSADRVYYPDTLVGTDSHTTMINGIGVVGWGVGGIEAEAAMLGQPVYFLTPDVIGVELTGQLREGVTATDLVLTLTEMLRREKVVGKFVEYFGPGAASLALPDRATIGNMAPEYGATMGFFPVDEKTIEYFRGTGRTPSEIDAFESYFRAQGLFGMPKPGEI